MFRNNRWIRICAIVLLGISLIATRIAYASQKDNDSQKDNEAQAEEGQAEEGQAEEGQAEEDQAEEDQAEDGQAEDGQAVAGQTEEEQEQETEAEKGEHNYDTLVVGVSDYTEKSVLKDIKWIFQKQEPLFVQDQESTFVEFLVSVNQEVKKGDLLLSYEVPVDRISLEELKISLDRKETAYQKALKQKENSLKDMHNQFQGMEYSSVDAQIQALTINKLELELEQFKNQTKKEIEEINKKISELEDKVELQYLKAPYDGTVFFDENMKKGSKIDTYREIMYIYDTKSAILGTEITGVNKFWYGMEVTITGISNMKEDKANLYKGKVISVDTLYNGKISTGMIYILPEDQDLFSKIQKANIAADSVILRDVLVIPVKAVNFENNMSYVYLLDDKGELRKQYIAGRDNGSEMWVYFGLSEGQRIVVE